MGALWLLIAVIAVLIEVLKPAPETRKPFVGRAAGRYQPRAGARKAMPRWNPHRGVELTRGERGSYVPPVDERLRRIAPRAPFQHPFMLGGTALQEEPRPEVEPHHAEACTAHARLRGQIRDEVKLAVQARDVIVGHPALERHREQVVAK